MYEYLNGKLVAKYKKSYKNAYMVLDINNIGYQIITNDRIIDELCEINRFIKVYISLIHKEDQMIFCGFLKREQRDIFNILQSVSGIGMKVALELLNEFDYRDLIFYVLNEDYKTVSKTKGVGTKLAQKIIIELKDKLINYKSDDEVVNLKYEIEPKLCEISHVLITLGYNKDEIERAYSYLFKNNNFGLEDTNDLLKQILNYLTKEGR